MPLPMTTTSYSSSVSAAVVRSAVDASESGPAEKRARETGRQCGTRRRASPEFRELPGLAKRVDAPTDETARERDATDERAVTQSAVDDDAAVVITRRTGFLTRRCATTTVRSRSARDASGVPRGGA